MGSEFFNSTTLEGPEGFILVEPTSLLRSTTYGAMVLGMILLPLCWLTLVLRIYTRTRLIKAFGYDDWAMIATVFFFTFFSSYLFRTCIMIFEHLGPLAAGQTPTLKFAVELHVATNCWYSATMIALKISLGLFFAKIFQSKPAYQWIIGATTIILTITGLVDIIITALFPCNSSSFFFADLRECVNQSTRTAWIDVVLTWTVLSMVSDILYAALSVIAIANIQLRFKKKVTAILLCTLGTMGGIAAIARLCMLLIRVKGYSIFGQTALDLHVLIVEPGLGIIAASAATLRPLVQEYKQWMRARRELTGIAASDDRTDSSSHIPRSKAQLISELELGQPLKVFGTEAGKSQLGLVMQVEVPHS